MFRVLLHPQLSLPTASAFPGDDVPFDGWEIEFEGLPEIGPGSPQYRKFGEDVRLDALTTFVRTVMQEGGTVCLWTRCWWTPELQDKVVELEQLLTRTLAPVVAKNTTPTSWLKGSKRGQRLDNPGIVARMLQEIE